MSKTPAEIIGKTVAWIITASLIIIILMVCLAAVVLAGVWLWAFFHAAYAAAVR